MKEVGSSQAWTRGTGGSTCRSTENFQNSTTVEAVGSQQRHHLGAQDVSNFGTLRISDVGAKEVQPVMCLSLIGRFNLLEAKRSLCHCVLLLLIPVQCAPAGSTSV